MAVSSFVLATGRYRCCLLSPLPSQAEVRQFERSVSKMLGDARRMAFYAFSHQRHLLLQHAFQIARQQIDFQINLAALAQQTNGGDLMGMRNYIDRKPCAAVIEINDLIDG